MPIPRRDFTASYDIQTFSALQWVGVNQTLGIAVVGNTPNVDPFVVAYTAEGLPPAQIIKVIAYNDDISAANRNSILTWTNNTNTVQNVFFVAFAFSSATRGQAFIQVSANGCTQRFRDAEIGGLHQYGATAIPPEPANCFPSSTRLSLQQLSGIHSGYALVVDTKAMRGGLLSVDTPNQTQLLSLPWIVNNPYPSLALLFRPSTGVSGDASWRFIQKDIYSSVN